MIEEVQNIPNSTMFLNGDYGTIPSSFYYCILKDQPDLLVPKWYLETPLTNKNKLMINSYLWFSRYGSPPNEIKKMNPWLKKFVPEHETIWVGDPVFRIYNPFWPGVAYTQLLLNRRPGEVWKADVPNEVLKVLIQSGILIEEDSMNQRRTEWYHTVNESKIAFAERGFFPVSGLIHPFHIGALRRYYRFLIRTGKLKLGDQQSPLRYISHNENVASFFHHQLTNAVSELIGKPVKPSYVYVASYLEGAELYKHTDREQCEYSVTLCLDYAPEPEYETPWPIYLDTREETVAVFQKIGDGLLYRGREIPHYRNKLFRNHTSTSIFFHFVDENFTGPLN